MKNKLQKWMEKKEQLTRDFEQLRVKAIKRKIYPYWDKFATPEYHRLLRKTNAAADAMLEGYFKYDLSLKGPDHFTKENVFVWGGPTPSWGGSMDKDASLKAQAYFDLENVMYVYGPLNQEMMDLHKNCKKLICHLGRNCRTKNAAMSSDAEEAELLSKLSLEYPNIVGGVVDDMSGNCGENYSHAEYRAIHQALHKHNPDLELYGVVYTWELERMPERVRLVSDCIDHVILWFWSKTDLMHFDLALERCRAIFPGKPIMLGIFMFDYGASCLPNSPAVMAYHFEKARRALADGKVQDIVILGDREIEKCPETAEFIREYLKKELKK